MTRLLPWLYATALVCVAGAILLAAVATGSAVVLAVTVAVLLGVTGFVVTGVRRLRRLEVARLRAARADRHAACSCCSNAADDVTVTDAEHGACGSVCGESAACGSCTLAQSTAATSDVTA